MSLIPHTIDVSEKQKTLEHSGETLEQKGRELYHSNQTLQDLGNVMAHPMFSDFVKKYFTDWTNTKAMLMLMKTYEQLDETFTGSKELSPFQKLALLKEIMSDSRFRQLIRDRMLEFTSVSPPQNLKNDNQ